MIPFQERKKIRAIIYSKVFLIILVLILFGVGQGAWRVHKKADIARTERDFVAQSFADITVRTDELQSRLARIKSPTGIEEEIRQKFTVARQGEEVVIIVDENKEKDNNREVPTINFWQRMVLFFSF